MKLSNIRIKTKLMTGFVAIAGVVLVVSGLAVHSLGRSNDRFADYLDGVGRRERLASALLGAAESRAIAARNLVLVTSPEDSALEKAAVMKADGEVKATLEALRASVAASADPADRALFGEVAAVEARYGPVAEGIVGLVLAGNREDAVGRMNAECRPLLAALIKASTALIEHEQAQAAAQVAAANGAHSRDRALMLLACLLAAGAAVALGWALARAITAPLSRAVALAESVASGDLRSTIAVEGRDETAQLLTALQRMNENLSGMVIGVRQSADGIATASKEIASGNADLSHRTEQQASALQQTAASMQQMTESVQQNAEHSRQARELVGTAAEVAGRGGAVVDRVVATMGEISASSRRIGDIIGVIDGIAFQTNILALNAAVEAARAGEQGRGFAVVASEVRSLAQRSATAAREIKALIGASVERVEAGGTLVGEAGRTMHDIVSQVARVADLVAQINASTAEQTTGIVQVNAAVTSIDQGTQQNAALVEESAAAAESMRHQASGLLDTIARFQTR